MKALSYQEVPATQAEDFNSEKSTWKNNLFVSLDEGSHVTLYIGHTKTSVLRQDTQSEEAQEKEIVQAFPIRVKKPVTRDNAINAAEMEAYALSDAMAVASFAASMARKSRENASDEEVTEHDEFIAWVKAELTKIGI